MTPTPNESGLAISFVIMTLLTTSEYSVDLRLASRPSLPSNDLSAQIWGSLLMKGTKIRYPGFSHNQKNIGQSFPAPSFL